MNAQMANVPFFPTLLKKIYRIYKFPNSPLKMKQLTVAIGWPMGFPMTESRSLPM